MKEKQQFNQASLLELHFYLLVGECLSLLQHLEETISHSLALKMNPKGSIQDADRSLKKNQRLTLGQAVKKAKEEKLFSKSLENELLKFYQERNWFVHRSIAQELKESNLEEKATKLFKRIKSITLEAQRLQLKIEDDMMAFAEKNGINMDNVREARKNYYS